MASARAQEVAELLWEMKRAGKLGTYTTVARRAGFSPGTNGRTMLTTMKTVRRDWPHLQWWRAVPDDGTVETGGEHAELLLDRLGRRIQRRRRMSLRAGLRRDLTDADRLHTSWLHASWCARGCPALPHRLYARGGHARPADARARSLPSLVVRVCLTRPIPRREILADVPFAWPGF